MTCELLGSTHIAGEYFRLEFAWPGTPPGAGQFFMVRPERTGVFLGRPISVADRGDGTVAFLIVRKGRGTRELVSMRPGEEAELTGPLGNAWTDFLPKAEPQGKDTVALIGGGIGLAPLLALFGEYPGGGLDLYAGFAAGFAGPGEKGAFLGPALAKARNVVIATEDGSDGHKGRIPDFFDPAGYAAVCACGPEPMLKAVAEKCVAAGVPCFVSTERRMACGVGACLGCTVATVRGNRRCCADGPIFRAGEVFCHD